MKKCQYYHYEDVAFQLEFNLQTIRRHLVDLLDEYEFHDCLTCNRLKCSCSKKSSPRSPTVFVTSVHPYESDGASKDMYYNVAPSADILPTPRWPENVTSKRHAKAASEKVSRISLNNWIRASMPIVTQSTSRVSFPVLKKVLDHVDYSWPPFPKSIWSDEMLKETIARERILCYEPERDGNSSVQAFFMYFSEKRAIPLRPNSHVDGQC